MAIIEYRHGKNGTAYRVKIRRSGAKPRNRTFKRKQDALNWAKSEEAKIIEKRDRPSREAEKHILAEAIERYKKSVLPQKAVNTQVGQNHQLDWWNERIGEYRLSNIDSALIIEKIDSLIEEGMKTSTVRRYMAVLSHLLSVAWREWRWIPDNPMRFVSKPREPESRTRFLSEEEYAALLTACRRSKCPFLYPVILIAISTGARKNEILQLKWSDIDLQKGSVTFVQTKNREKRAVPLIGPALDELREMAKVQRIDSPYVFPSKDGKSGYYIRRPWQMALQEAGIENFRFHDLRHTAASFLCMSGASLPEVGAILGHRTPSTTKKYSHFAESHLRSVVERMVQEKLVKG